MIMQKIRAAMAAQEIPAVLLTDERSRRYVTGFHTTAGAVYISQKQAAFFTDFRYIEAARAHVTNCAVGLIGAGQTYTAAINDCLEEDGIDTIALEDGTLTHAEYLLWDKNLHATCVPLKDLLDQLRMCKSQDEVDNIVQAQRIAERAFAAVCNDIKVGVTEQEIAARLTYLMLHHGAENMSFDPIVVSGANSSMPHGVPTQKPFAAGDFITMDFGCIVNGYCSDMTRTVAVGHVTDQMHAVYHLVLQAQLAGIAVAKAGVAGCDIDGAGRAVITEAGYGEYFGHGFGHGVGLYIHELPNASMRATAPVPAGAIVTAEPGIYLPDQFGVRIEDMLLITQEGNQNLTLAPKDLLIL